MSYIEKYSDDEVLIRPAKREDMSAVAEMIQELADFEKMSDGPKLTAKELERDGFDSCPPLFVCQVAALRSAPELLLGYAVYFPSYSTWRGRALQLEDLYVRPGGRRRGLGSRLFGAVAQEAVSSGCCRLDFHVLEWNPARAFYERAGADNLTRSQRWCYYRVEGGALAAAAAAAGRGGVERH